jgi:DNA polymerase-1
MAEERRTLYLVDGSWFIFRAFHVLPPLSTSRGLPTGTIYGFIRMLLKLLKDARPTHMAVVFDSPKKTFRDDLFESYKANREEAPSDLLAQIPYIHRAVEAFRIPRIMVDGYEADDVIGTLAARAARDHFKAVIVTGDKDFMQIVEPNIGIWNTMSGKRIGPAEVRAIFGLEPAALIDVMALTGDTIDNVKGVPGVGDKKASALIQHFGSIEGLYGGLNRIGEVKGIGAKLAAAIKENRAAVELARKLVRVDIGVPLEIMPADLSWPGIDQEQLAALLRELEFGSLLAELAPAANTPLRATAAEETAVAAEDLAAVLEELGRSKRLAIHLVEDDAGAATLKLKAPAQARVYALGPAVVNLAAELIAAENPPKTCHDQKRHIKLARRLRTEMGGVDFDTMLAGFLVNPGKPEPSLADLYHEHLAPLGGDNPPGSEPAIAEALRETLAGKLERDQLSRLFTDIELPTARVLAEMERAGIGVDADALKGISAEFGAELARLERECFDLAAREFNLNSPIQLRDVLFTHLKLSAKGLKKTKSGYSTDADTLEKLAAIHPLPRKLIEYRAIAKLKSTYSDALPDLIDAATGRIHTSFHQALTATGRLSSTDPNLQNIPTRSEAGRRIRRAFVAAPGHVLLSADYSQIELRILAHLSGDTTLVDAFSRDEDIHARTAREILGENADAIGAEARRLAKVINFGIIYGMGPQRLAGELAIPLADASAYIKRYFERLPGVRGFLDGTLREARERGFVATMYGRRRYLPELRGPDGGARAQAERIAINTPIQGSAADLIKLAMVRLHAALAQRSIKSTIVLQVHDELLLETPTESLSAAGDAVRREMEGVAALRVPLKVELKAGPNWAEMRKL